MKNILRKLIDLLCSIGLHKYERKTYKLALNSGRSQDVHYAVCKYCGAGDPMLNGES